MKKFWLVITKGRDQGQSMEITPGISLLGRLDSSQGDPPNSRRFVVADMAVSRTHCQIVLEPGGVPVLTHLSQTNATYVNGQSVSQHPLVDGEMIQMGHTTLQYRAAELAESNQAAAAPIDPPSAEQDAPAFVPSTEPAELQLKQKPSAPPPVPKPVPAPEPPKSEPPAAETIGDEDFGPPGNWSDYEDDPWVPDSAAALWKPDEQPTEQWNPR